MPLDTRQSLTHRHQRHCAKNTKQNINPLKPVQCLPLMPAYGKIRETGDDGNSLPCTLNIQLHWS